MPVRMGRLRALLCASAVLSVQPRGTLSVGLQVTTTFRNIRVGNRRGILCQLPDLIQTGHSTVPV